MNICRKKKRKKAERYRNRTLFKRIFNSPNHQVNKFYKTKKKKKIAPFSTYSFSYFSVPFWFVWMWNWFCFSNKMLITRSKFHRNKTKKIHASDILYADDLLVFDFMKQYIGVCCCSVLTLALDDANDVMTTNLKTSSIDSKKTKNTTNAKKQNKK